MTSAIVYRPLIDVLFLHGPSKRSQFTNLARGPGGADWLENLFGCREYSKMLDSIDFSLLLGVVLSIDPVFTSFLIVGYRSYCMQWSVHAIRIGANAS